MTKITTGLRALLFSSIIVLCYLASPHAAHSQAVVKSACAAATYTAGESRPLAVNTAGDLCVVTGSGGGALPAGTNVIGKVGIDQTTPGTTNGVALTQIGTTAPGLNNPLWIAYAEATDSTGTFTNATQTTAITANNADGYPTALLSINGTYGTATAVFEASDDGGTTWYATFCARNDGTGSETGYTGLTNITRQWICPVAGNDSFRVRSTAVTSGTANVRISVSAAPTNSTLVSGTVTATGGAANGAAVSGNPVLMAGSNGVNAYTLATDTAGRLQTIGPYTVGSVAPAGTVQGAIIASDGTNGRLILTDASGRPADNIAQINAVTPLMGNGVTGTGSLRVTIASDNTSNSNPWLVSGNVTPADATGTPSNSIKVNPFNQIYNGTTWDFMRAVGNTQATAGTGLLAVGTECQLDDVSPTAPGENNFIANRCDAGRAIRVNGSGVVPSYSAAATALALVASATDIYTVTGSATKTIKITRIQMTCVATAAATIDVILLKRSAADTAGTSTAPTRVPNDSADAAATATVLAYTANPTPGALVGNLRAIKANVATAATPAIAPTTVLWSANDNGARPITLRGVAEVVAINLNGATIAGGSCNIDSEWTEE